MKKGNLFDFIGGEEKLYCWDDKCRCRRKITKTDPSTTIVQLECGHVVDRETNHQWEVYHKTGEWKDQ